MSKQSRLPFFIVFTVGILISCSKSNPQLVLDYQTGDEKTKTEVVEELLLRLNSENYDVLTETIASFGQIADPRGAAPMIEIATLRIGTRMYIEESLTIMGPNAVGSLIPVLSYDDVEMRRFAARILGRIRDLQALDGLNNQYQKESDGFTRMTIAEAIGQIPDEKAMYVLIENLKMERNMSVRSACALGLGNFNHPESIKKLRELTNRGDVIVQKSAVRSLGKVGSEADFDVLEAKLVHWDIKKEAAESLKALGWEASDTTQKVHYWIANGWGDVIQDNWSQTQKVLFEDVGSGNPNATQYGLFSFISIGKREVIPILELTMKNRGTVVMANAYLNCGVPQLADAAKAWALTNGYTIETTDRPAEVKWGELN